MKNNINNYDYTYRGFIGSLVDFQDKDKTAAQHVGYMLNRTQKMFKYEGLPETIPARELELMLQTAGFACITKVDGKLYAFTGGLGGAPDVYYQPTICVVANPALSFSKELEIGKDCVIVRNDTLRMGLLPLLNRYATALAENELTINIADINARIISLITANNDTGKKSAEEYINQVKAGKLGIIADKSITENGVIAQPYGNSSQNNITQLLELEQYLKGALWQDLGLQSAYNMKREALNSSETSQDNDVLLPFIDDMHDSRTLGFDEVNALFGTNITVGFSSAWENNEKEADLAIELLKKNVASVEDPNKDMEAGAENKEADKEVKEITEEEQE